MVIDLMELRKLGKRPRVHGNGFIQLDLNDRSRLHIWGDPRIPRQKTATMVHDHVFGFRSIAVVGRLVNVVYDFLPDRHGSFRVWEATCGEGEDTKLEPTDVTAHVRPLRTDLITPRGGWTDYHMSPYMFHETMAPDGPAATIITKDGPTLAQNPAGQKPRVLVKCGQVPDNDFNRYDCADEEDLWYIMEDVLSVP